MLVFGTVDDVFAMAVRIKENGRTLYSGAAKGSEDQVLSKLFADLAELEDGHILLIKDLRARYSDDSPTGLVWDPEGLAAGYLRSAADTHVFTRETVSERMKQVGTAPEVLDMAVQFEKDTVHFLVAMKEMLLDEQDKDKLDELIRGQMDRIGMLSDARRTCRPTRCEIIP
ncbi:MAG: ferritin family protein [Desulfomonilaceae bacterium]|nr:ferritin family protein [Desulfomonilaceae bacterium]